MGGDRDRVNIIIIIININLFIYFPKERYSFFIMQGYTHKQFDFGDDCTKFVYETSKRQILGRLYSRSHPL